MAHFQTHIFFSILRVEFVPSSALIPFILCFILQAFQYSFELFIPGKSSEVMLAADPILLGQNMRFRSFISIRPFINNLADGHAYSLEMIKG